MIGTEALITLNALVMDYLSEFNMRPKPEDKDTPSESEKAYDALVKASQSDESDYDSVRNAVSKTVYIMRDIENNLISHNLANYIERRRAIEQINSILHIGRAYPQQAISRVKALRPKHVYSTQGA
jgi:hypothetical protein